MFLNDAPIMNKGYYDVPINNQFSNIEYRDTPVITNEYQLNKNINVTMNDNNSEYVVYQQPTRPSKSLYTESDQQTTQYYNNERALSFDSSKPLMKKKELENFYDGGHGGGHGGGGHGGGHGGGGHGGGHGGGYGGGYGRGYGVNPYITSAYLNTQIMPNISRNYWEYPDYGYEYQYIPEYIPEYAPIIKQPPYNIIPKSEDIKIESLINQENIDIENKKPKKKRKCNKVYVSNQILWFIIIILLLIIIGFIIKHYYQK